jgi:hypothetical protein
MPQALAARGGGMVLPAPIEEALCQVLVGVGNALVRTDRSERLLLPNCVSHNGHKKSLRVLEYLRGGCVCMLSYIGLVRRLGRDPSVVKSAVTGRRPLGSQAAASGRRAHTAT